MTSRPHLHLSIALLSVFLGFALQFASVQLNYGGNWTGLFCTGANHPVPPALSGEGLYIFQNSNGYDGQFYHYAAHDPLLRTDMARYMDSSRKRYERILFPAFVFLLALGQPEWIDTAYIVANLIFLFFGAWWLSQYLDLLGYSPKWAVLFALTPAALVGLERLTLDLAFAALCIGFAFYTRRNQEIQSYVLVMLASLTRDTGIMLAAAACFAFALDSQFKKAAVFATTVLPTGLWYLYVDSHTPSDPDGKTLRPFIGIVKILLHPSSLNLAAVWLERLALLGFLAAAGFTVWLIRRNGFGPLESAMALWSLVGLMLPDEFWSDVYSGPRVFTPLLIFIAVRGIPVMGWPALIPLLMVTPRVLAQVALAISRFQPT